MGVHSDSLPLTVVDDYADTILAQQISQIDGVSQVSIGGEQKPAIRVQVDPAKLAAKNLTLEDIRAVIGAATTNAAKGTLYSNDRSVTLAANDQLSKASDYADVIVAYRNGAAVRIKDVGEAIEGPENLYTGAWDNGKRAVLLVVFEAAGRQCHRDGGQGQGGAAAAEGGDPAGDQRRHPVGPHRDHPRLGRRRRSSRSPSPSRSSCW